MAKKKRAEQESGMMGQGLPSSAAAAAPSPEGEGLGSDNESVEGGESDEG